MQKDRSQAISARPLLATAQRLVTLHGCGDVVECRLGAGLSVLRPGEADDIVIAGVSGVTVCGMLEQAPEAFYAAKPDMRFIFIPATKHPFLRRWLGTARLCAAG